MDGLGSVFDFISSLSRNRREAEPVEPMVQAPQMPQDTYEAPEVDTNPLVSYLGQTNRFRNQTAAPSRPGVNLNVIRKRIAVAPQRVQQSANKIITRGLPYVADTINGFQSRILPKKFPITQLFGNRSAIERFSRGINYGTDIGAPMNTPVAVPPGKWKVVSAFTGAKYSGPRNPQGGINKGYGNSVLVQNVDTGEKLRYSHLSKVGVKPGQILGGGVVVGATGATGNVAGRTGQHLDLEYYNNKGKVSNILSSPYRNYL